MKIWRKSRISKENFKKNIYKVLKSQPKVLGFNLKGIKRDKTMDDKLMQTPKVRSKEST